MGLTMAGCPAPRPVASDAEPSFPAAESRFGNDPELLADFDNLKACARQAGRLDHGCPQYKTLRLRLEIKRRTASRRRKMVTTLANLLESRRELTRLAVAHNLYPVRDQSAIRAALRQALSVERAAVVQAVLLRQACWTRRPWAEGQAVKLLSGSASVPVRVAAAACLAQPGQLSKAGRLAVDQALRREKAAPVLGNLCAAVANGRLVRSSASVVALLKRPGVGWRCAPHLAALGTPGAYRGLLGAAEQALGRGDVHAALVSALGSMAGKPFYQAAAVNTLLGQIVASDKVTEPARARARAMLKQK